MQPRLYIMAEKYSTNARGDSLSSRLQSARAGSQHAGLVYTLYLRNAKTRDDSTPSFHLVSNRVDIQGWARDETNRQCSAKHVGATRANLGIAEKRR